LENVDGIVAGSGDRQAPRSAYIASGYVMLLRQTDGVTADEIVEPDCTNLLPSHVDAIVRTSVGQTVTRARATGSES
jgi:hypothetical protein